MTCKLFWQESPQLFYASNTFVLTCDSVQIDGDKTLQLPCDFFEQIGPSNKSALRSIIVDLGDQRYLDEAFRGALWQVSALAQLEPQMEVRCRARCIFIFTDLEHTVTMTVRDLKGSVAMLVQDIETQMSAADDFSDLWWDFEDIRQGVQDAPGIMFGRSPRGWDEWDGIES
ncbi:hypothetical protein B0A55_00173 [Friedmanniomyces simplex]|uniref:Uncharacterized protein n=1 Tax=Friedmanniomyces simplex TaxID=329884 RepID=A0A4U0Y0E7_9PEZI|nr:hypothetical protein B0A55_00173 [Friedmanniomyces simplex]